MGEMASAFGQAVPMVSALGVEFEEAAGFMATLTGVTGNTSLVTTQLTSLMTALIKPTTEMERLFERLQVASGKELIESISFSALSSSSSASPL